MSTASCDHSQFVLLPHLQPRLLTTQILDALITNAGRRFQRSFADEPLLERLRVAATSPTTDPDVRARLKELFASWAREYKDQPGLQGIAVLHKQFPQRRKAVAKATSTTAVSPTHAVLPHLTSGASSSSASSSHPTPAAAASSESSWRSHRKSKSKSSKSTFNLEKEKPALNQCLASSSVASTNLMNSLKLINRERERPSEKSQTVERFETCKTLRRELQRYIQHIESEQWLGSLIHAHEEITTAMALYEEFDKPIDEDSDSEDEDWDVVNRVDDLRVSDEDAGSPSLPPRPTKGKGQEWDEEDEEDDPNDPFGNQYEVVESEETQDKPDARPGMTW